jgi:hypothetical protein
MAAGAWFDDGPPGPSTGDFLVCHEQSAGAFGKQEYKCTTGLKGNGKKGGITFEAEIKYDTEKDE